MGVAGHQAFTYRRDAIGAEGLAKQFAHGAAFGLGELFGLFSQLHWKADGNGFGVDTSGHILILHCLDLSYKRSSSVAGTTNVRRRHPIGTESEMDEPFYDKWILALLCRYAATFIPKDEFLIWHHTTMMREMADHLIDANFAKWEACAAGKQFAFDHAARQA